MLFTLRSMVLFSCLDGGIDIRMRSRHRPGARSAGRHPGPGVHGRARRLSGTGAVGAGRAGSLAALPVPLGSLPELFRPAAFAGPGGTPLTAGRAGARRARIGRAHRTAASCRRAARGATGTCAASTSAAACVLRKRNGRQGQDGERDHCCKCGWFGHRESPFPGSTTAKQACSGRNDFGRGPLCKCIRHVAGAEDACAN